MFRSHRSTLRWVVRACVVIGLVAVGSAASLADEPPPWAYPANPAPPPPVAPDDGALLHVPDSSQGFSLTQIRDLYSIPDWHPGDHPPMPEIVAQGHKPGVFACGYCHLPNGLGRAENSSLAGLPAAYIEQQLADYRSGARGTAKPQRGPPSLMIANSKQVAEQDVREAARYFAALPLTKWVRVVEAETVPKTRVAAGALLPTGEGIESLGERIIELPENLQLFDLRDSRSGFVAYVPPGSVAKGRQLVANGVGSVPCETCHGPALRGAGPIPGIAGRSPSYIVRQLYDFQHGIRAGAWSALMAPQVAKLTISDMIAVAAYTASLPP